jgi:predicted glycosyltransferase
MKQGEFEMVKELEEIVNKCVEIMFNTPHFVGIGAADRDYDIVQAFMDPDGGWTVVLLSGYRPERMYMFNKWSNKQSVSVSTYIRATVSYIKF